MERAVAEPELPPRMWPHASNAINIDEIGVRNVLKVLQN